MKKISIVLLILLALSVAFTPPCKSVKKGMTKQEVIKLTGMPGSTVFLGLEAGRDSIILWNYGNQQVSFFGDLVDQVVADVQKVNELLEKNHKGEIPDDQVQSRFEAINQEACQ